MVNYTDIQVIDARDIFIKWNKSQLDGLSEYTSDEIHKYIKLIPLFLHLNHKMLPGYISDQLPGYVQSGVYGYQADKATVNDARLLNSKFRYQHEEIVKNAAVESVFFQRRLVDGSFLCWIFNKPDLSSEMLDALKTKIEKISQWLYSRGAAIKFICLSGDDFISDKKNKALNNDKALFLDNFYSESIVLAGKYPVWWLVSPSKEGEYSACVEHIKQARFVDNDEFIDLASPAEVTRKDFLYFSVNQVQTVKLSAEICLVNLLVIDNKSRAWPDLDGVSFRLKEYLYQNKQSINLPGILTELLRETFSQYAGNKHLYTEDRLFSWIKANPGKLNPEIAECFLAAKDYREVRLEGVDNILASLSYFKAIADEIRQLFGSIVDTCWQRKEEGEEDSNLLLVARNMQELLSDSANRVPLYNSKDITDILFDRILLRYQHSSWSLLAGTSRGDETILDDFTSLLGLLAWCWLNRVVNHSTQISIDCPSHQVRQIEARYVLEILMQYLDPKIVSSIPPKVFEKPAQPLKSLLFMSLLNESDVQRMAKDSLVFSQSLFGTSTGPVMHCEQLIINSWGDVYTKEYTGNAGMLQCLCEWTHHAPLDASAEYVSRKTDKDVLVQPQSLKAFSYGTGDSTHIAQRMEQIYSEIINFFYKCKISAGRFVLRMENTCYVVTADNGLLAASEIGRQKALIEYLQAAVDVYQDTALERLAFTEQPLCEMYQRNKKNVLQVFFQIKSRRYHVWVLDEKGTLWTDIVNVYDRDSYVIHWLYLFRNIRVILKKKSAENSDLPSLEICQISINPLGEFEFHTKGAEALSGEKQFYELQVKIEVSDNDDQLSLVFEDQVFLYSEFRQNVLMECIQYMSASMSGGGHRPVFVTDIDIPLSLYHVAMPEMLQISHILKFKRNFEHRINKLLQG
ncbi:hypothetical protein MNBD_GAMMA11-1008 [hydrothermal vent metagenome]|uniref:Adenylate cyclase class-I N-terminal domain-containing protein n=1 Tax=hydrothermal vent metagenome TaxID=652676 RepID=A0A3B0X749_9ZZZZ